MTDKQKTTSRSRTAAALRVSTPAVTSGQAAAQGGFPKHLRFERNGRVAILINEGAGWIIHCREGVFQNGVTKKPHVRLKNAKGWIKKLWNHGDEPRWTEFKREASV